MQNLAEKLIKKMDTILEWISMVLLACIVVAAALQVFTRKVLGNSMVGTEEFARYCFIWMSCLGASLCLTKGMHASIDVLKDRFHGKAAQVHAIFSNLVVIFVCCIMIRYGFELLGTVSRQSSPTLGIPMNFIYAALPVSSICMLLSAAVKIGHAVCTLKNSNFETEKEEQE